MLKNAYLLAKIGDDTAENERNFAVIVVVGAAVVVGAGVVVVGFGVVVVVLPVRYEHETDVGAG